MTVLAGPRTKETLDTRAAGPRSPPKNGHAPATRFIFAFAGDVGVELTTRRGEIRRVRQLVASGFQTLGLKRSGLYFTKRLEGSVLFALGQGAPTLYVL